MKIRDLVKPVEEYDVKQLEHDLWWLARHGHNLSDEYLKKYIREFVFNKIGIPE